jgi:hypothetical protein
VKIRAIAIIASALAASVIVAPAADAAKGPYKNCAAFNKKYPVGIARSVAEAEAAVARGMERPSVKRKVYLKARKANKRLGTPQDGVLCEVRRPITAPSAPRDVTTSMGATNAVNLQWNDPVDNGNGTISAYVVRGPGTITVQGNKATVSGLQPDTEYAFEIVAVNEAGEGEAVRFVTRTNPAPTPTPTPTTAPAQSATRYANCTAARAAGVTPIRRDTNPSLYAANSHLDRDKDGVACE